MVMYRHDIVIMLSQNGQSRGMHIVTHPWLLKGQRVLKTMQATASSHRCSEASLKYNKIGTSAGHTGRTHPARPLHATALPREGREQLMLESLVRVLKRRLHGREK